ncbi:MAG: diacylglycerol kinase family lipid kinase [Bacteroidota bacterium]|nr:diacylglycerol kinase family lipid kinase [Bacteroidota bacterium]
MKFKKIHIIINPAAGQEEPILSYINKAFLDSGIDWEVSITKQDNDASTFAKQWVDKVDVIAVYGGDGSISEVARVLKGKNTPMAIIPGGTANVISKELGIPQNTLEAIELLKGANSEVITVDMATNNGELFLIRVNLGIMADMVMEASRELKDKLGQLAYGITAIQTMLKSDPMVYKMKIDNQEVVEEGVALTITNCGNIGVGDYSFAPDISIEDGFLDVILLQQADLMSVLKIAGTTLMKTESEVLMHWKCKEIEISLDATQKFILDDFERETNFLHIKVLPNVLKVIVPLNIPK